MKYIKRVRVDGIEPAKKFEGKWFVYLAVVDGNDVIEAKPFLCSHKQMGSVQKCLDLPAVFAAFEHKEESKWPRFIWASGNRGWLQTFLDTPAKPYEPKPRQEAPGPDFNTFQDTTIKQESVITEEDIPF